MWIHVRILALHQCPCVLAQSSELFGTLRIPYRRRAVLPLPTNHPSDDNRELPKGEAFLRIATDSIPTLAWSADQATGWGWQVALHPDDRERVINRWRAIVTETASAELVGRLRRFDGVCRWFIFRATPSLGQTGNVIK